MPVRVPVWGVPVYFPFPDGVLTETACDGKVRSVTHSLYREIGEVDLTSDGYCVT